MGVDAEFRQIGYLHLISSPDDLAGFEQRVALQRHLGVDVRIISLQDAREIVPALSVDDLIAAVYCPTDGYAGPYEVTRGYVARARDRGGRFCEGTRAIAIRVQADRVVTVETNQGRSRPLLL